jgi:L-lactate dehydrogenase complex protein LldF
MAPGQRLYLMVPSSIYALNLGLRRQGPKMDVQAAVLIEQFKSEAARAGFVIHEASSAKDTISCILKLVQERDVKNAVRSKSKLADEIKLREHLEKAGIEVKEADLKEWIAQLSGEQSTGQKPVRQDNALISKATGKKLNPDPQALLDAANGAIRQYCIDADLGISEADVAIAETGTLVIAGNEGATRLVAVLPQIHITLVDCQNVVRAMEDVFVKIKSMARGRTGQVVPGYVTYITGRNTTADIPGAVLARAQGPAEEHILLINNAAKRIKV